MNQFRTSESGAVTVDWVVLTAGLVGLGLATMAVVSTGVQDAAGDVDGQLRNKHIMNTSFAIQYEATVGDAFNFFATPRCGPGSSGATCYPLTSHTVTLTTEDGRTITHDRQVNHYSGVDHIYSSTWTDENGETVDPSTLEFTGGDCITTDGYGNGDMCFSDGYPDAVAGQTPITAENYPDLFVVQAAEPEPVELVFIEPELVAVEFVPAPD